MPDTKTAEIKVSLDAKAYEPKDVEPKWTKHWLEQNLYKAQITPGAKEAGKVFSIALPPPNVTGELHMGHALGGTIQDVLIRYNRMQGKDVLWQIGTDHAGIGTQIVVEKFVKKEEHKNKYDYGREAFIEKIKAWKEDYGNRIIEQMKKMGFSPDYDRCRYTMDDHYAQAVKEAFVKYFNEGKIYRGKRITNWCPKCLTSLSDLEVEKQACKKKLYEIKYFIADEKGRATDEYLVVATTRPETMFGDTAVAINPNDERFKALAAQAKASPGSVKLLLPFTAKLIPLVLDEHVKTDFGTGALKVTPAHDANDYDIGKRHDLPQVICMDEHGQMLKDLSIVPEEFQGLDRYKARDAVVEALEANAQLVKISEYEQEKDEHDRCHTEIEPYLSDQWYVDMQELAKIALKTVRDDKRSQFIPERYEGMFSNWLENIQDWCISRQIWWGHRIPVFYYEHEGELHYFASSEHDAQNLPVKDPKTGLDLSQLKVWQDEDVLDTWFSSALWPFETLKSADGSELTEDIFNHYYPTDVLATAREIINLWVSRMIYSSEYFEGKEPYKDILIHPVVQTPDGKRMSKSKGNAINPLDLVDLYGADASRMWYASVGVHGNQDVRFPGSFDKKSKTWSSDTIEQYRKFCNKLYNASKFVMLNLGEGFKPEPITELDESKLSTADKWILSKFDTVLKELEADYLNYDLAAIQSKIYEFMWFNFCDWYIEFSKNDVTETTKQILFYILEASLRLLHPIMPFITEEIWQALRSAYDFSSIEDRIFHSHFDAHYTESISFAQYPGSELNCDYARAADEIDFIVKIISNIRNSRQTLGIAWSKPLELHLDTGDAFEKESIENCSSYIKTMVKANSISTDASAVQKPAAASLVENTKIFIPLAGLVDIEKVKEGIQKKIDSVNKDINGLESRLNSDKFVNNAPKEKVDAVRADLEKLLAQRSTFEHELAAY